MARKLTIPNREELSALAYQLGWAATKRLPEPVAERLFNFFADVASGWGKGPDQLRRNLSRVVGPEKVTRDLVRRSMRSYLRYWKEAFRLPSMVGDSLAARLDAGFDSPVSKQRVAEAVAEGKGLILTLPHSGNWDMAGVWLVHNHGQFATVAERLKPESLFDAFVSFRNGLGFEVLPLTGGDVPPMQRLEEVLRSGGIVCLMGERDLTGRGVTVDFFGEQTSMPAGPAKLAQKTGAALHVAHSFFGNRSDEWGFSVGPRIPTDRPTEEVAQDIADGFERNIAAHPADWHMLQPLFFADLSAKRRARLGLDPNPGAGQESAGATEPNGGPSATGSNGGPSVSGGESQ